MAAKTFSISDSRKEELKDIAMFVFLDNLYLAYCTDQMRLLDENGEKLGKIYLKKSEKLFEDLDKNQKESHILHVAIRFAVIKMRIAGLEQDDNSFKDLKKLYRSLKHLNKNCDNNTLNCFIANLYLEMTYLASLARFGDVEKRNEIFSKVQDLFDDYPQHQKHPIVNFALVIFYQLGIELAMSRNDVFQTDRYVEKNNGRKS